MRGRWDDDAPMKDRRRRFNGGGGGRFVRSAAYPSLRFFLFLLCCALFFAVVLSTIRLFGVSFRPVLLPAWRNPYMNAVSRDYPLFRRDLRPPASHSSPTALRIEEAVSLPDLVILFMKPLSLASFSELRCIYFLPQIGQQLSLAHLSYSSVGSFVRCPLPPKMNSFNISLFLSSHPQVHPVLPHRWDQLVYTAILDQADNSTIVFAKGHNLRPARLSNPASFECIFGWDFSHPKFYLSAEVTSAAQEIFRCHTPLSILHRRYTGRHLQAFKSPLVSVRFKAHGSFPLPSIARPESLSSLPPMPRLLKPHRMCVCTMLRNQARFLREWILYHSRIGIERWFIYDNNSDDDIEHVVASLSTKWNLLITLHEWPWVKTQEAGFAHCALRARPSCEWVGFIDVDEFLYFPSPEVKLHDVLRNYSKTPWVAEIRTACHSFGPSGRKKSPPEGVMVGYTCRIAPAERHKSIVRPEALNPSLINVVHHFHLKNGMKYVNMDLRIMVINHYKYQAWEVFKEKFYRRVATYVADWQAEENVGSKDRAPGLGTKAVEPSDWVSQFCEVNDTGLRDLVFQSFVDRNTGRLPW